MAGLMIIPAVFAFTGGDPDTLQAGPALMFITIPKYSQAWALEVLQASYSSCWYSLRQLPVYRADGECSVYF